PPRGGARPAPAARPGRAEGGEGGPAGGRPPPPPAPPPRGPAARPAPGGAGGPVVDRPAPLGRVRARPIARLGLPAVGALCVRAARRAGAPHIRVVPRERTARPVERPGRAIRGHMPERRQAAVAAPVACCPAVG